MLGVVMFAGIEKNAFLGLTLDSTQLLDPILNSKCIK